jgi:hypothetical protein
MELYDPTTPQAELVAVIGWDILSKKTAFFNKLAADYQPPISAHCLSDNRVCPSVAGSMAIVDFLTRASLSTANLDHSDAIFDGY